MVVTMELTPIKIPGKRRRKGEPPIALGTLVRKDKAKGKKQKIRRIARPKASYLEKQLPLEIMERIFWASENVNFAKSGLRIGHLLSGKFTRRETFLQAFGSTWDVWFGCVQEPNVSLFGYHGWQEDSARFGGNPDFQVSIVLGALARLRFSQATVGDVAVLVG
jgi:hypothetical protein